MDWIEVTARTVDDAKELALDRLGVIEDELEYEVLDEPKSGLFRRTDARIRARVKPLSREKPVDRHRRRRSSSRSGGEHSSGSRSSNRTSRPAAAAAAVGGDAPGGDEPKAGSGNGGGSASSRSRSRRRRGGSGRGGANRGGSASRPAETVEEVETSRSEAEMDAQTVSLQDQAAHAAKFAEELVRAMGFDASVTSEVVDDDVEVQISGEHLGVLVGPKGVTLQALEEVVRAAAQHHAGGHSARVHVDVAGYRQRRREALAAFAHKVAEEVKSTGEARSLEPMSAADRKVVHDAIAELGGLSTSSEGEDPRRRVVIRPE